MRWFFVCLLIVLPFASLEAQEKIEKGSATFTPTDDQKNIPERYRLPAARFDYELTLKKDLSLSDIQVWELRFPSPVTSPYPENNTVWAEYYRPRGPGPFPCVIVLDITGGNQTLSRVIAQHLAQHGVGGLFVQMAYYGPRRPPNSKIRLLSIDAAQTVEGMRQTVLDLRYATAWMESRLEINAKKLGIMGTSLGSFVAALTAEMEPKLDKVAVLLGGGGFVDGFYYHGLATPYRVTFEALGGQKEMLKEAIAPVDPLTMAERLKGRKLLMVAAKNDEIIPRSMTEDLWKAAGEQQIVWLDAGHYTAVVYLMTGLDHIVDHFK